MIYMVTIFLIGKYKITTNSETTGIAGVIDMIGILATAVILVKLNT